LGNGHPNIVPYQDFPTADGGVIFAVGNDRQFAALCGILFHPEWAMDVRFRTNSDRVANRALLIELMSAVTVGRNTGDWVSACEAAGVPCGPINDLKQVFNDPQVIARGLKLMMPHPAAGEVPLVASPLRLNGNAAVYDLPPPRLGEHTREVLRSRLALSDVEIKALIVDGIIEAAAEAQHA
jgi:crotonobetainyl-CoA:carnitine CoA-transferase CaiB-like acyl-CoA transferase